MTERRIWIWPTQIPPPDVPVMMTPVKTPSVIGINVDTDDQVALLSTIYKAYIEVFPDESERFHKASEEEKLAESIRISESVADRIVQAVGGSFVRRMPSETLDQPDDGRPWVRDTEH